MWVCSLGRDLWGQLLSALLGFSWDGLTVGGWNHLKVCSLTCTGVDAGTQLEPQLHCCWNILLLGCLTAKWLVSGWGSWERVSRKLCCLSEHSRGRCPVSFSLHSSHQENHKGLLCFKRKRNKLHFLMGNWQSCGRTYGTWNVVGLIGIYSMWQFLRPQGLFVWIVSSFCSPVK